MATAQMNGLLRYLKRLSMADDCACVTDGDLLNRFLAAQDTDAFEALVRRHGPSVFGICRQVLGNPHDAEDAFQATFLVLLHKARSLTNPEVVGSWLCGTAYYTARNARVTITRRRKHEERASNMASDIAPQQNMSAAELQPILEELARLPDKFREPLTLCELQGKSREQVAKLLQCPEGTLSSRLARGRELLRNRLARRGFHLSVGLLAAASTRETLKASLPPSLVADTMQTVGAWLTGDVVKAATIAGNATALAKTVLGGLAANKVHTLVLWLVGLATVGGTGVMIQQSWMASAVAASPLTSTAQNASHLAQPLLDFHGDPLPAGAIARLGTVRWRPGNEVTAIAFSPDGSKIASGPIYSNVIQIWDRASGRLIQEFHGHLSTIMQIEFAGAGKFLISSSLDKSVRIWDTETGRERLQLRTPWPGNFCLTPDGRVLAVSNEDYAVHLWSIGDQKEIRTLKVGIAVPSHTGREPIALAFSPDGKRLATGDPENLRLWDVASGRLESTVPNGSRGQPHFAGFNGANITVLSTGFGAPCTFWSLAPGDTPRILRVEPGDYALTAFAPDGASVLFSTFGHGVRQLDTVSGNELKRFTGIQGNARAVAISRDGKLAAAGTAGSSLHQWDLASGKKLPESGAPVVAVDSVAIARDGKTVATTSADGVLHVWDAATSKQRWQWSSSTPAVPTSVAISPDGSKIIAGGLDKGIHVFDAGTGKLLAHVLSKEPIKVLGLSSDGQTVVGTQNGRSVVWVDSKAGRERSRYPDPAPESNTAGLHLQYSQEQNSYHLPCSAVSQDGKFVAIADQGKIRCVHEDSAGKVKAMFMSDPDSVSCLAFSSDALTLASAGDNQFVLLWDVASGKPTKQLDAKGHLVSCLAYSPDGRLLAAGTSLGKVLLWDLATGKQIAQRAGHLGALPQLAFSQDSKLLVSAGGTDTTALIWDVTAIER